MSPLPDEEPVVGEGAEAICAPLDEFHFAMEALGDAVVTGEAPHADDLLGPVGEGLGEGESGLEAALTQGGYEGEELPDVDTAVARVLVFRRRSWQRRSFIS